jgi:DNA-binding beta-propeller fold protein YncE
MKRLLVLLMLTSLSLALFGGTPTNNIEATKQAAIAATLAAQSTETPSPKPQGMGPTIIANTEDGKNAYVGFHLSDTIAKVRLADLTVEAVADLSQYFPLQCYRMALDASEKKLFVHSASWRKLIVLDTQTLSGLSGKSGVE